jgi:hypothetical protein
MPELDIPSLRLRNQHLLQPQFSKPAEIVKWLGAVQAQDYTGAKWALGQRLKNCSDEVIEAAFANGDIIRTHVLRPTWHFVAPADLRWMTELTSARIQGIAGTQYRQHKLDHTVFSTCEKTIQRALEGGNPLMRNDIAAALQQAGVATNEQRFIHIMMQMELIGLVCSGGRVGKQFTYAIVEERVPPTKPLSKGEALATLAERYFTSHGPATLQDFAWWSGLTVADAKSGLEMIKHKLASAGLEGTTYWLMQSSGEETAKSAKAYLLPNYDEYIVSYKDRGAVIREKDIRLADPRGTIFNHTFVISGKIEGIWKREIGKNRLIVELIPFRSPSKAALAGLNAAAGRYAKFLGLKEVSVNVRT